MNCLASTTSFPRTASSSSSWCLPWQSRWLSPANSEDTRVALVEDLVEDTKWLDTMAVLEEDKKWLYTMAVLEEDTKWLDTMAVSQEDTKWSDTTAVLEDTKWLDTTVESAEDTILDTRDD